MYMGSLTKSANDVVDMRAELARQGLATAIEAAKYLHLSKPMIHKLIGEGKVPACRYGRAVRIPWNWLRAQAGE
jgi:excisionase family DNA binding protein